MILFLDTSALVKAYVRERGTDVVREQMRQADSIAISVMTSVEFCSALNRKVRDGTVTPLQRDGLMEVLLRDTQAFIHVPLLSPQTGLIHSALRLITEEGLRGPDAIQLASALHVMEGWGEETLFSCADRRLIEAAHHLGLPAVNPEDA